MRKRAKAPAYCAGGLGSGGRLGQAGERPSGRGRVAHVAGGSLWTVIGQKRGRSARGVFPGLAAVLQFRLPSQRRLVAVAGCIPLGPGKGLQCRPVAQLLPVPASPVSALLGLQGTACWTSFC